MRLAVCSKNFLPFRGTYCNAKPPIGVFAVAVVLGARTAQVHFAVIAVVAVAAPCR
jgi:hypothetical protein